jgi:hypothetical protein
MADRMAAATKPASRLADPADANERKTRSVPVEDVHQQ